VCEHTRRAHFSSYPGLPSSLFPKWHLHIESTLFCLLKISLSPFSVPFTHLFLIRVPSILYCGYSFWSILDLSPLDWARTEIFNCFSFCHILSTRIGPGTSQNFSKYVLNIVLWEVKITLADCCI
jgi:hypothetical protein